MRRSWIIPALLLLVTAFPVHAASTAAMPPAGGAAQETALDGRICTTHTVLEGEPVTLQVPPGATAFEAFASVATPRGTNVLTIKTDGYARACFPLDGEHEQAIRIPLHGEQTLTLVPSHGAPGIVLCNPTFIH